ncbi:MAG: DUF559 domain-containing protein [Patescibacteria group bacterium]
MKIKQATNEARALYKALKMRQINCILEHWDGHKHTDICIPGAKIYIEVDGMAHYTNARQIKTDFIRDHYSDDNGFDTIRIPNELVFANLNKIANAIAKVVEPRVK